MTTASDHPQFWDGINETPALPLTPTDALPGSAAKLQVMTERVERGEQPHHPDDARDNDDGPGYAFAASCWAVRDAERKARARR